MEKENKVDEEVIPAVTEKQTEQSVEQDPLKTELEKVQSKTRTKAEKLQYSKKRIEDQLKELGIEDEPEEDDDSKPLTKGDLKKFQVEQATKSALDLANAVSNETERELLKYHLENTIRSTGNPAEDFKLAQNQVYAVKNQQILEELDRKPPIKNSGSGGAPAKHEKQAELTADELPFLKAPWYMSKEKILAARPQ